MERTIVEHGGMIEFINMPDKPYLLGSFKAAPFRGRIAPFMQVNTGLLLDSSKSDRTWQLVIYHEYQHMSEFINGDSPEDFTGNSGDRMSEEHARRLFAGEYRAYLAQCRLATSLRWEEDFPFCYGFARGGENQLRRDVGELLSMNPEFQEHRDLFLRLGQ